MIRARSISWMMAFSLLLATLAPRAASGGELEIDRKDAIRVTGVAFSPTGDFIAVAGKDIDKHYIRQWVTATLEPSLRQYEPTSTKKDYNIKIAYSPRGGVLLAYGGSAAQLFDLGTGREIRRYGDGIFGRYLENILTAKISPDEVYILTGGSDGVAKLWNIVSGDEVQRFVGHDGAINDVAFSPDRRFVLTGGKDATVRLWDRAGGRELGQFGGHAAAVNSVAFSPDGRWVLTSADDFTTRVWDAATGAQKLSIKTTLSISESFFLSDNKHIAASSGSLNKIFNAIDGSLAKEFEGYGYGAKNMSISANRRLVAVGGWFGAVTLWDIESARELVELVAYKNGDWLAVTPDGYFNGSEGAEKYLQPASGRLTMSLTRAEIAARRSPERVAAALNDMNRPAVGYPPPAMAQAAAPTLAPPSASAQPATPARPSPAQSLATFSGPRLALVIYAKSYAHIAPLDRTLVDADKLAEALRARGFAVTPVREPDRRALAVEVAKFAAKVRENPNALAFVFYAGHGVAIDGANYLLPVDFPAIADMPDDVGKAVIQQDALSLDKLLADIRAARPQYLVALFDACRDNPLSSNVGRSVGVTRGLARVEQVPGTYIAYTAGQGEKALDRLPGADASPNGLFMRHYLNSLNNHDWTLDKAFKETAKLVQRDARKVNHQQNPMLSTQIYDDIVLGPPSSR